jgi:Replication-relaxation
LAIIDVLIAAERLSQEMPGIELSEVVMERELKRWRMQTTVPGLSGLTRTRTVTVVPDALFSLTVGEAVQHFVLEVDRNTEHQWVWRDKVAALTYWLLSPDLAELFSSDYITVMIVTPSADRTTALRMWTEEELRLRGLFDKYASRFAITAGSPATMSPVEFFMGEHWHPPYIGSPDSLIDRPVEVTA